MEQNLLSRRRQGLSINKFKLVMILTTPKSMDRWIEYVLKSDVEELDLDFFDIRYLITSRILLLIKAKNHPS